ncbi:hypothetical protein NE237_007952 [Protea cynaroides]|uniref:Uncharacterized protein n=1 Tax=Protea cynaroides TaxID=273540 RepID=A0A9Q0KQ26_9MAGN|nr:hypothetical protein NE237_007952 [Protea cynaroides]
MVIRMLPIWATTIIFWIVYTQMTTFSVSHATTMDRHIGSFFQIPAASLTVFFVGNILVTVPIYDLLIVPLASHVLHNPQGLTPLQHIAMGFILSILTMVAAALTELKRLRATRSYGLMDDPTAFFLVGAREAFIYIDQLDFFLRECPKCMKTMSTGIFLSTLSLGFFLSSLLVSSDSSSSTQAGFFVQSACKLGEMILIPSVLLIHWWRGSLWKYCNLQEKTLMKL